jgi:hypothetical protein
MKPMLATIFRSGLGERILFAPPVSRGCLATEGAHRGLRQRSAMNVATVAPLPAAVLMRADAIRVLVLLRRRWRGSRRARRVLLPPPTQCHWWHP